VIHSSFGDGNHSSGGIYGRPNVIYQAELLGNQNYQGFIGKGPGSMKNQSIRPAEWYVYGKDMVRD
jgi:hypothetical protein